MDTKSNVRDHIVPDGPESSDCMAISHHVSRYRWVIDQQALAKPRVLDLGCGDGYGTSLLRRAGFDAIGVDVDANSITIAKDKYQGEFAVGDIRKIPYPDGHFDSVVCFEVIEHIPVDPAAFAEIGRVIRPGGTVVMSTPNVKTFREAGRLPYHIHEFTREEMEHYLGGAGFVDVKMYGQSSDHPLMKNFHNSTWNNWYVGFKRKLGLYGPLVPRKLTHAAEKVVTGHSSANWQSEQIWSFKPGDERGEIMLFVGRKP